MKIKKVFASILATAILISSLSLPTFANSVIKIKGTTPTYLGKNINLDSWISYTIPSFNGVPYRVPGDEAFYSGKGEIKLNINDQNRSYFENGGSLFVYVKKAVNKLHLNRGDFFAYKPNSFKIKGPNQLDGPNRVVFLLLNKIFSIVNPANGLGSILACLAASCTVGYFTSWWIYGFLITPVLCLTAPSLIKAINNLCLNLNSINVNFDYGIVLTDEKDELVLNPNLPKVGDINKKAVLDWKKQKDKEAEALQDCRLPSNPEFIGMKKYSGMIPSFENPTGDPRRYTKQDIDKMKKEIDEHKAVTYAKFVNTVPINDGLVCKLDKDHPSQTFRFVINNQFPDNPHNADLFALALQNNSVNLSQPDTRVSFVASYNAISPDSNVHARLANVPLEIQQKINLINNIGTPDIFTRFSNLWSSFTGGNNTTVPTPGPETTNTGGAGAPGAAPGAGAPGAGAPGAGPGAGPGAPGPGAPGPGAGAPIPVDPRVAMRDDMLNDINGQFLNEAIYNYRRSQTQENYARMQAALDAFNNRIHLDNAAATAIHATYQVNIPPAPPAPQAPQAPPPQWHWYNPRSWF